MKIRGQTVYSPQERIERLSIPEPNSGCWLWLGAARPSASGILYGRMVVGSRSNGSRRTVGAHRYSYEAFKKDVPGDLYVCHKCDNGLCVNPAHLFLGTQSENMKDGYAKGRVHPPHKITRIPPPPPTEAPSQ